MNGLFVTRNLQVAAYLVALGAPFPTTKAEESNRPGVVTFEFPDPTGEWLQESKGLDLSDAQADTCHVPRARLFYAQKLLRDHMNRALGRNHSGVMR
jgi:hypothetical protein